MEVRPVAFRYQKEIDAAGSVQFEVVAEEVEDVSSNLVVAQRVLKTCRKNEQQEATIAEL